MNWPSELDCELAERIGLNWLSELDYELIERPPYDGRSERDAAVVASETILARPTEGVIGTDS